jgi:hypothetical protein
MVDLLDIAPSTSVESVKLSDGRRLTVRGLHCDDIAGIVARFPELLVLIGTGSENALGRLIGQFGQVIAPVIAAGCNHIGDAKAEATARTFLPEDAAKLFRAIFGLTFPNGIGSFMETMMGFMTGAAENAKPVKVRLKRSPSSSPTSSGEDFHPTVQ